MRDDTVAGREHVSQVGAHLPINVDCALARDGLELSPYTRRCGGGRR